MESAHPFLLRFRTRQRRGAPPTGTYDWGLNQLLINENGTWIEAIASPRHALESKKADIEKGEDQKGP